MDLQRRLPPLIDDAVKAEGQAADTPPSATGLTNPKRPIGRKGQPDAAAVEVVDELDDGTLILTSHLFQSDTKDVRARLVTDENGYYEYETIMPGRYKIGPSAWRPAHIHYMVRHPSYSTLITQLYFKGDPMNAKDRFIKKSLIIDLAKDKSAGGEYRRGEFDVVLAKG